MAWEGRKGWRWIARLGAENAGLDACSQEARGEKAIQEKQWGKESKRSVLVQWRRKREA